MAVQRQTKVSKIEFIKGHLKSLTIAIFRFLFKDNNISLILNLIYHSTKGVKLLQSKRLPTKDRGILHLGLAILSVLAVGKRKSVSKRSALIVLSSSSIGHVLNAHYQICEILISMMSLASYAVCIQQTGRLF